jgi:hypothetical protein
MHQTAVKMFTNAYTKCLNIVGENTIFSFYIYYVAKAADTRLDTSRKRYLLTLFLAHV